MHDLTCMLNVSDPFFGCLLLSCGATDPSFGAYLNHPHHPHVSSPILLSLLGWCPTIYEFGGGQRFFFFFHFILKNRRNFSLDH
jgi:hypothetical protein